MLVYTATKKAFSDDVLANRIEDKILSAYKQKTGRSSNQSEIRSWKNSLGYMNNVLTVANIPDNAGVSIEYHIPQTSKRIDFVLTGQDADGKDNAIIVELKQWENVSTTSKDGIVRTHIGGTDQDVEHPSYQAWTYAALLYNFNETVRDDDIKLRPCAYLHNCRDNDVINHSRYAEETRKAPAFLKNDVERLAAFLRQFVKYGDSGNIMYRIENGKISPSKSLADSLESMIQGNQEFIMIDEQKLVYETSLYLAGKAESGKSQVLIVEGGPGTGKSVVAINLLVELTKREKTVQYVTKNAAPRTVYESKLTGSFRKSYITNLFKGSGAYTECAPNTCDALIVDEAHRLNEKSGMFQNLGENQIMEIIKAAKHSVFFIDEDQRVTFKDIGERGEIVRWAEKLGAEVHEMKLSSQFRCNGSNGYLAWLDDVLQIKETANQDIRDLNYEFQVMDSPNELRDLILRKNKRDNKARLVAGYCWDWVTKKASAPNECDIVFPEDNFAMKWNLSTDGNLWIVKPESVNEIGCIHTCQGLELDYVGVIIGPDLIVRNGEIQTVPAARAKTDQSLKGYKQLLRHAPDEANRKAELIIKNTYRTLMTRGQKGCYIYCTDAETAAYFKGLLPKQIASEVEEAARVVELYPGLHLPLVAKEEVNAVPIFDLKIAAGQFSESQNVGDCDWVKLPEFIKFSSDLFVAQVVGESMNKRIPNGSWCLFREGVSGSRQGKIVLVQHHEIYDEDLGGQYTVKRYESEKTASEDSGWVHSKVTLKPETTAAGYDDIVISDNDEESLRVIAEFVAVL